MTSIAKAAADRPKPVRFMFHGDPDLERRVADFRFSERHATEAGAIRALVEKGLAAFAAQSAFDHRKRS